MRSIAAYSWMALLAVGAWGALPVEEDAKIDTDHLSLLIPADGSGAIAEFGRVHSGRNAAAGDGLLLEGFGTGSFYVPNRRLNVKLEVMDDIPGRPVLRYTYDCDGPNIRGLKVRRFIEPLNDEASVRVRWKVENQGDEDQWVAPWVRNELAPGGKFGPEDRVDVPTLRGVVSAESNAYYAASRNWIAATDTRAQETIYAVFNADETHSFLALRDSEESYCGFQTAFVPRLFKKGAAWETEYRVNLVRGLTHVDFATAELAAQLDYTAGRLVLLMAGVKELPPLVIKASVLAPNGRVWRLDPKRFTLNPETVVRCTYEWQAPSEGSYEFLARLSDGTQAYDLGKGLNAPHGGIDTQFTVGDRAPAPLEAWTEAPHALDRAPRTLERTMAVAGDTAIWFESPLQKVFPDDKPVPMGSPRPAARISLARNEHEPLQLVVRPPEGVELPGVSLHVNDLVNKESGARIAASNIAVHQVQCVPITVPTHFEGPTGLWPDPLPPLESVVAEGGQCQPLWITVYAPAETPAGVYSGLLELRGVAMEPVELWLEAVVYDFALPTTPALKTDFGFWEEGASAACKGAGYAGSQDALNGAFLDSALAHRATLRELTQFPAESADYAASLREYEPRFKDLLGRGASTFSVPASLLDTPEQLKLANAFAVQHKAEAQVFCQLGDNPPQPAWPRLFERAQQWRDTAPAIPLMVTTFGLQPFLSDAASIWAVHTPMFDTVNNRVILERLTEGGEVWCYVNHGPPRPYANFFIDFACVEHRALFWQMWALGVGGFHYWNVDAWDPGRDPWRDPADITPANGDGSLLYPGPSGPVSSIRWETIRDGIEDYDYLVLFRGLMRKLGKTGAHEDLRKRAEAVYDLKPLIPNLVEFSRDPNVLQEKRDAIAKMIVELQAALE